MSEAGTSPFHSFRSVIALWRTPDAMASEIGARPSSARKWDQRDKIPSEWWSALVASDTARDAGVTLEILAALASARPWGARREPEEART